MTALWKSGTKKAYYGYVANLIIGLVGGIIISLSTLSAVAETVATGEVSYPIGALLVGLAGIAAFVYYFLGVNEMKKAAASTALATGTNRLFIGAIIYIVAMALSLIPMMPAIVASLVELVGFIIIWTGYSEIKKNATDANAQLGGANLSTSALLSVIAAVVILIPVLGWIAALVLEIIALVKAIKGWKLLAESELA